MGGGSLPLENGERHSGEMKRSCRGTGLAYLGIAMMEELNEL